jgi:hypothetical protein
MTRPVALFCSAFALVSCGEDEEQCRFTEDCSAGQHCANGICGAECYQDQDCAFPGEACDDRGRCIPGGGDADTDVDVDSDSDTDTSTLCDFPYTECNSSCVLLDSDPSNCGGCGIACDDSDRAPSCVDGDCVCGVTACLGTPDDLCCFSGGANRCVDTQTDGLNCGGCGWSCESDTTADCVAGSCTCGTDGVCSGLADDTCCDTGGGVHGCVDMNVDPENCGFCGNVCDTDRGGECSFGGCTCGVDGLCAGTTDDVCCDTGGGTLRCVDTERNRLHCGACGVTCDVGELCYQGDCQCGCEDDEDCVFVGAGLTCDLVGATDDCDSDGLEEGTCS